MASLGAYNASEFSLDSTATWQEGKRLEGQPELTASNPSPPPTEKVLIITADSRILVGILTACDQNTNLVRLPLPTPLSRLLRLRPRACLVRACLPPANGPKLSQVLSKAVERIIREPDDPEPSTEIPLGLYLVRGDNVCSIGLVDEKLDDSINWTEVKGSAIGGIKHI